MTNRTPIITQTEEFVFDLFKRKLPDYLVYHTYAHTESVAEVAQKLAVESDLGEEGIEVAVLAALLHDTGYTEIYKGHEEVSVRIAAEFLRSKSYPEEKIEVITGCIRATRVPQAPRNILEEIVADADLSSLGRKRFFEQGELLRIEWERAQGRHYTDDEWLEQSIDLLSKHTFYTRAAQQRYAPRQSENLRRLYKEKAERMPPPEEDHTPIVISSAGTEPQRERSESALWARTQRTLYLNSLADQRSQFLFIGALVTILLAVFNRRGIEPPMLGFLALLFLAILCAARALSYRVAPHGTNTLDPDAPEIALRAEDRQLGATVHAKERMNRYSLGLLLVGMLGLVMLFVIRTME